MAKKITQYPASSGNPDVGSVFDISELSNGNYTSKKITLSQLLNYMNANLTFNTGVKQFLNDTSSTLLAGSLVSIYGANTTNASVDTNVDANQIMGQLYVAIENISGDSVGDFISEGVVNNLNTSAYVTGTKLFWDFLNNTFTNIPNANGATIFYGIVLVQSSSVGSIYVSPTYDFKQNIAGNSGEVALFEKRDKVTGNVNFTYVDNVGTEVGYRIQDGLNNLTQLGVSFLNVETQGNSQNSALRLANWSDQDYKGLISFRKSRGDKFDPLQVLSGDVIGTTIYTGQAIKEVTGAGYPVQFSVGMTIAEVLVRAKADLYKAFDTNEATTISNALAQYEIYLQSSNAVIAGDFTPLNSLVFAVNGDGKVQFKNYSFPSTQGAIGTTLISNGSELVWGNPISSSATTLQTIGRNSTGDTLRKGTIVYISGSTGNRPNFVKAKADAEATSAGTFGVVVSDIANNADGYVVTIGTLEGLDTRSNATYPFTTDTLVDGDTLYLSPTTAGYVTNVKPSAPNHIVYIGKVTITSPTNGAIVYRIQNGYELEELHNVAISTTPTDGQVLTYETATNLWKAKTPTTGSSLTGTGASNRIAYWNSANSLTFSDYLTASVEGSSNYDYGRIEVKSSPNLGNTYQSIYLGSFDANTYSNGRSAQLNLSTTHTGTASDGTTTESFVSLGYTPTISANYPISNDKLGSIRFLSKGSKTSVITAVSNENHSTTNKGTRLEFYVCKDGTFVDFNALTLGGDGRVKISNAYKLPLTDGTANQVLATDANGSVSWTDAPSDIWTLPHHGQQRGQLWSPATTTKQNIGNDAGTVSGTPVAKTPTSGNELSERISCKISVSSPAVNGTAYVRGTTPYYFRTGGLLFSCGFAVSDTGYNETASMFCGLKDTATMALNYTAPATLGNSLWNTFNIIGVGNDGYCASITGSVSGTTLTISAISYGTIEVGQSFSTSVAGTKILSQLTGTPNGIGTYQINISQTITNSTMRVFDPNLCIIYNDNTGNAIKIPLGDKFPANRTSGAVNTNNFYIFEMYFPPYNGVSGAVQWRIRNTYNDVTPIEASGTIINNIIANQYPLNYHMYRSSMGNSNACSFDISHIFCSNLS